MRIAFTQLRAVTVAARLNASQMLVPSPLDSSAAAALVTQGPTVWQACLGQLVAHLEKQGLDPGTFAFLSSRNYFSLFAVGTSCCFVSSVFGQQVTPVAMRPDEAATWSQGKIRHPFPFAWPAS